MRQFDKDLEVVLERVILSTKDGLNRQTEIVIHQTPVGAQNYKHGSNCLEH